MRKLHLLTFALLAARFAIAAEASYPAQPYPAVRYEYRTATEPAQQIHIAKIDLSNPDIDVRSPLAEPILTATDLTRLPLKSPPSSRRGNTSN